MIYRHILTAVIGLCVCLSLARAEPSSISSAPDNAPVVATAPREMQTIGVIGGISWVSSLEYYRRLNELVAGRLGGLNSAAVLMYSIPFGAFSEQERLAEEGDWAPLRATMLDAAARLRRGGADFIIIASNTMNSTADLIEEQIGIPVLHIADATGAAIKQRGIKKVALLGTRYTMEADFYRRHLRDNYSLEVVVPNADERRLINDVIFDELCANIFRDESRQAYIEIIERLARDEGTEGVILGCTEIPLLIQQKHVSIPVFDTTAIHTEAAVERALQGR